MAIYCIGDVHGCDGALLQLLRKIDFSPSRDHVYLVGDLVNRGPDSLGVLRRCMEGEASISVILGNHDMHLIASYYGVRKAGKRDTLKKVLAAPDIKAIIEWLCRQPLLREVPGLDAPLVLVHAGLLPQWTVAEAKDLSLEVEQVLRDARQRKEFMRSMYGNEPAKWSCKLKGEDRLRVIVNAMTRLRFCSDKGRMDFESSESAERAPEGLMPWFEVPGRASADTTIAFGHWSTLGLQDRCNILALDSGCVWGGGLTAMRFETSLNDRQTIQLQCEAELAPG